jgi:hypothetical protein
MARRMGDVVQLIYNIYHPTTSMQLFEFTIVFGVVMMALAQLPSFHSLRYINLASLLCSLGYSLCAVAGCIYTGQSLSELSSHRSSSALVANLWFFILHFVETSKQ